ncbi:DUF4328 domain-containing protein (plasmid) [Embleya sp. NBC_00888]|uniref:DUF4328 domain-containing protein n=1 Tax=Embleya sp. NBC_00888 TaxID=2975960 RepID=UPI003870D67A|nr:DUF4328 domain-containing protein [Embleya sp. NBC_00888]
MAGMAAVATTLILLVLVREVLVCVHNWREYFVVHDYLAGTATDEDVEAVDSEAITTMGSLPLTLLAIAAPGAAFLAWLWRARVNSELMGGADGHRRSRNWVVGSWISPVINLWYPRRIVSDIWRTSAPRRPVSVALINAWWASFVLVGLVRPLQWRTASDWDSEHDVLVNANLSALLTGSLLVAGALIILIIRRITTWQTPTP